MLAVNILGRFLASKDPNIKCVVEAEAEAVWMWGGMQYEATPAAARAHACCHPTLPA